MSTTWCAGNGDHWITSSEHSSSDCGTERAGTFADLFSQLVQCWVDDKEVDSSKCSATLHTQRTAMYRFSVHHEWRRERDMLDF
jgi:hypothetical protein